MSHQRDPAGDSRESVWDYPRPPRLEATSRHLKVLFNGVVIAETRSGYRVLETSHPPVYYFPPRDVNQEHLQATGQGSFCEWKGEARYYSVCAGDREIDGAAWAYPQPSPDFEAIRGYLAFYAQPMDGCFVDGERVTPQPGGFYGGWITSDLAGPFKGVPGSRGW